MAILSTIGTALAALQNGRKIIETANEIKEVVAPEKPTAITVQPPAAPEKDPIVVFEALNHAKDLYEIGYETQNQDLFDVKVRAKRSEFQVLHLTKIEALEEQRERIKAQKQNQANSTAYRAQAFDWQIQEIERLIEKHQNEISKSNTNEGRFQKIYSLCEEGFLKGVCDFNCENSFFNRGK